MIDEGVLKSLHAKGRSAEFVRGTLCERLYLKIRNYLIRMTAADKFKTDDAALRITGMFFYGTMGTIKLITTLRRMGGFEEKLTEAMVVMDIEDTRSTRVPGTTFDKKGWWRKEKQGWRVMSNAQWPDDDVDRKKGRRKNLGAASREQCWRRKRDWKVRRQCHRW